MFFFILKLKFLFLLKKKSIVVFDGECLSDLEYVIEGYEYFVLEDRIHRLFEIYITPKTIFFFIKHFYLLFRNYSFKTIYNIAIIDSIKPKIVLTAIDNSISFFLIAKVLSKKYYFLAIQCDYESAFKEISQTNIYPKNYKKILYIPNFICWGKAEIEGAKEEKLKIEKFYNFGSIRLDNFLYYIKRNNIMLKKNLYDICFISSASNDGNKSLNSKLIDVCAGSLLRFTIKYAIKNNLKFIFASRGYTCSSIFKVELDYYKLSLNRLELDFLLSNIYNAENKYSSQSAMFQSKLVIGFNSTLLFERIALKEKLLSCNMSDVRVYDFPIKGICSMNQYDYNEFSARVALIIKISKYQ
jgi:uncharacterized membrane protein (Fun14 family)